MATQRMISGEFWQDDELHSALSDRALILYIGYWSHCDDQGVYPASLRGLWRNVGSVRGWSLEQTDEALQELLACRRLVPFQDGGKEWWWGTRVLQAQKRLGKVTIAHPMVPPELVLAELGAEGATAYYNIMAAKCKDEDKLRLVHRNANICASLSREQQVAPNPLQVATVPLHGADGPLTGVPLHGADELLHGAESCSLPAPEQKGKEVEKEEEQEAEGERARETAPWVRPPSLLDVPREVKDQAQITRGALLSSEDQQYLIRWCVGPNALPTPAVLAALQHPKCFGKGMAYADYKVRDYAANGIPAATAEPRPGAQEATTTELPPGAQLLVAEGVGENKARDLSRIRSEQEIRDYVAWWPLYDNAKPLALLIASIRDGYEPPPEIIEARRRERNRQAERRENDERARKADADREWTAGVDAYLARASEVEKSEITDLATAWVTENIPEIARSRAIVQSRVRSIAGERAGLKVEAAR